MADIHAQVGSQVSRLMADRHIQIGYHVGRF